MKNISIPPGIFNQVIQIIKDKIASGVYEPSIITAYNSQCDNINKRGCDRFVLDTGRQLQTFHSTDTPVSCLSRQAVDPVSSASQLSQRRSYNT